MKAFDIGSDSTFEVVTSSGISATALIFFKQSFLLMIPWLVAAIPLIILDLVWAIKAIKYKNKKARKKERDGITFTKGLRMTTGKIIEYIAWSCFGATASLAFERDSIQYIILGLVYLNELASIIGHYFDTRDIEFSFVGFYRWLLKVLAGKAGEAMDDFEAGGIIKPKDGRGPARSKRTGRFVKQEIRRKDECIGCNL